jgi:rifampicin phosphotransferase
MSTAHPLVSVHYLLPLDSPMASLAVVGGKGANLARLASVKFPVPGGFLLTTYAYKAFVAEAGLGDWIIDQIHSTRTDDPDALEATSARIRMRFRQTELPATMAEEIRHGYARLGQPPVAVRSSATAEDLPDMSFAGQQDTYLNIVGEATLLQAVRECWSSLWTARAIGYRSRNAIDHKEVALAVVVQEMVQSDVSGVLFTANPLSGRRHETVIDATLGLGEALVGGLVEPDHYVVEMASRRILEKRLGAKATVIRGVDGGGTYTESVDGAGQQALPDAAIQELSDLGRKVADFYGDPQDIEWAYADGRLYLLQARPITSLFPLPEEGDFDPLAVFFSFGAVQGMLDPMTPLGQDMIRGVFAGGSQLYGYNVTAETQHVLFSAGGRLWARIDPMLRTTLSRTLVAKALLFIEPGTAQAVESLLDDPRLTIRRQSPSPQTLARLRSMLAAAMPYFVTTLAHPEAGRREFQQNLEQTIVQVATQFAHVFTLARQIEQFEYLLYKIVPRMLPRLIPRVAVGVAMINRWLALTDPLYKADQNGCLPNPLEITRGLPHNVTTEMDLVLWTVATVIRQDAATAATFADSDASTLAADYDAGRLPYVAQAAIAAFLDRYGARGLAEIDLGRPRWRETPRQVIQMIQNYLHIEDPNQAPDLVFSRGAVVAQQAIDAYVAAAKKMPNGWLYARLIRWTAQRVRALAGLRESPKFFVIRMMGIVRQAFLKSGADLVDQGILEQADDLFFLYLSELKQLAAGEDGNWRQLAAQRRADYRREMRRRQIPRLLLSDGRAFYEGLGAANASDDDGVLTGSPVSPGMVEGTVHVVFDPHGANLLPGEILVCPGTDPAWTPLFLAAAGLVMEVGGLMTHGSVVAREYGIPAVVGVDRVTERLKTGQRVRVDGSAGQVTILDEG